MKRKRKRRKKRKEVVVYRKSKNAAIVSIEQNNTKSFLVSGLLRHSNNSIQLQLGKIFAHMCSERTWV